MLFSLSYFYCGKSASIHSEIRVASAPTGRTKRAVAACKSDTKSKSVGSDIAIRTEAVSSSIDNGKTKNRCISSKGSKRKQAEDGGASNVSSRVLLTPQPLGLTRLAKNATLDHHL